MICHSFYGFGRAFQTKDLPGDLGGRISRGLMLTQPCRPPPPLIPRIEPVLTKSSPRGPLWEHSSPRRGRSICISVPCSPTCLDFCSRQDVPAGSEPFICCPGVRVHHSHTAAPFSPDLSKAQIRVDFSPAQMPSTAPICHTVHLVNLFEMQMEVFRSEMT